MEQGGWFAGAELEGLGDHGVEEVAVVGDDDHGALVVAEVARRAGRVLHVVVAVWVAGFAGRVAMGAGQGESRRRVVEPGVVPRRRVVAALAVAALDVRPGGRGAVAGPAGRLAGADVVPGDGGAALGQLVLDNWRAGRVPERAALGDGSAAVGADRAAENRRIILDAFCLANVSPSSKFLSANFCIEIAFRGFLLIFRSFLPSS